MPNIPSTIRATDILREYASAIRHSWGNIDGRSEKLALESIAAMVETTDNAPLMDEQIDQLRNDAGLCRQGHGYWDDTWGCDCCCDVEHTALTNYDSDDCPNAIG